MEIVTASRVQGIPVESFPYRGKLYPITGLAVRWLSNVGMDESGAAEYGLRYFTLAPGGEIPIHKHFYSQTVYILSGDIEFESYDEDTDASLEVRKVSGGDAAFLRSMEPHAMRNIGTTECAFLCCICNVYENEDVV